MDNSGVSQLESDEPQMGGTSLEQSSKHEPIALLQPVNESMMPTDQGPLTGNFNVEMSDSYYYQTQSTTTFHHKIQLVDVELSEIKEQTVITKADSMFSDNIEPLHTILLHTRTMGNLQLLVRTMSSVKDEIIDQKTSAYVTYNTNDEPKMTRLMSPSELKQFKRSWTKLWRSKFSDEELVQQALLENMTNLPIEKPLNFRPSRTYDQIEAIETKYPTTYDNLESQKEPAPNLKSKGNFESKNDNVSMLASKASMGTSSKKIDAVDPNSGWETYVEPGYDAETPTKK